MGVCGAAASLGAALCILHQTGPLSDSDYYKDNLEFTSRPLGRMAKIGGPRCCKRNAFLATTTMMAFMQEKYGMDLGSSAVTCTFSPHNQQCIRERCPFYNL